MMYSDSFKRRYWAKVSKNGPIHPVLGTACWLWTTSCESSGYGQIKADGTGRGNEVTLRAHKVGYELANGNITEDMCILHKCNNKRCVNPEHLYEGTQLDNSRDMVNDGIHPCLGRTGEKHPLAKLTWEIVREIRAAKGIVPQLALAAKYGVSQPSISLIQNNKTWIN